MPKKTAATPKPLAQLSELLPATTNDELLELIVRALEAAADRLKNYAGGSPSIDILNEGIVFGHRLKVLTPGALIASPRLRKLTGRIREYQEWLASDLEDSISAKGDA